MSYFLYETLTNYLNLGVLQDVYFCSLINLPD